MGVKKKTKPSPKVGKLLAQVKGAIKKSLGGHLFGQMGSLPQVEVPITSTEIGSGPPKKLNVTPDMKKFLDALKAGREEIYKNTKGTVHPAGMSLGSTPAFVLKKWQEAAKKHQKLGDVKDVKLVEIAGVPTLVGKGTFEKGGTPGLTYVPSSEELATQAKKDVEAAVQKGKLVGFKASDFIFQQPYIPVYTTPPIVPLSFDKTFPITMGACPSKEQAAELAAWTKNTVKGVLHCLEFEPFDETVLLKARSMIVKHFVDTVYSDGAGPPALFKTLGRELIVHRTAVLLCHSLEALTPSDLEMFEKVFPPCGPSVVSLPSPFAGLNPITAIGGVADWMLNVAQIVFDFTHWQSVSKKLLLDVRTYIEEGYEEDLLPRLPVGFVAIEKLPREGVVHYVAVRVRHMLIKKNGPLSDEDDALFADVFPLPDPSVLAALAKSGPFVGTAGHGLKLGVVKTPGEVEAIFGKPTMTNEGAKYTALLLKNTQEYLKAHPEAAGVGPLDGAGIVQMMIPFNVVNPNGRVYPKEVWDKVVKKLQPKFSKEAEKDAKAQGFGDTVEAIVLDSLSPGTIPEMEIKLVVDKAGDPYLETWCAGNLIDKRLAPGVLTQKGRDTLDRFGVKLKGAS